MLSELTDMCAADDAPQKIVDIVPGQRIVGDDLLCEAVIPRLVMFPFPELADVDKAKRLPRVLRLDPVKYAERQLISSRLNQKIRIELSMGDFMDGQTQLQRRTTDICVIEGKPLSSDEWEYVKLVDERLCAVMSAANPLARLKSVTFQELQGERIILFEANNTDDSGYADKRYTQLAGEVPTSGVFQKTVVLRQLLSDHGINPTQYLFWIVWTCCL